MDMAGSSTQLDGFELLADTLGEMVSRHDADGRYIYASAGTRDLVGYEPEELIGRSGFEFIHPGDLDDLRSAHASLVETTDRVEIRYRHRRKDGTYAECEAVVRTIRGADGMAEEFIVVKRDARDRVAGDVLQRQWEICFKRTSRGITVTDARAGTILSLNPALAEMHGGTVGDFVGKPLRTLFTDASWQLIPDVRRTIDKNTFVSYDSDHVRLDGTTFPVRTEVMAASDERGDAHYRIAWYDDLSERQAAERRAVFAERDFEAAFHASPHGVAIVGLDGRFMLVNQKLADIVGYPKEQLVDLTFQEITHPDDLDADLAQVAALVAGEIDSYEMEKRYYTREGRLIWVLLAAAIVRDEDGAPRHFISQIQDISTRKRLEAHTYELANRDAITSLYNRRRFEEELRRQIGRCREEGESAALLLLDLDRFKNVNDSDGHVAGDQLIRSVGRALDDRIDEPDVAARIGGDEFAVILRNIDLAQARAVAEDLRLAITAADTDRSCTASLGLCRLHGDVPDAETCFRAVDRAMYRAKGQGRDRVVVGSISERRA
ncbi:MAG TPA: PAS domain S-box protein [Solirubrobacterales bacterium]|jgi:diguanylate cyclase (GGDEF)-like protein/PAS domain S-box-containing protein|nr:PAS domain S-box protein [Solirubrobacterales bacterium]